jgi:hypothetical protein
VSLGIQRGRPLLLDTNLAVLLYVGLADISLIQKHQRLSGFDTKDFFILKSIAESASKLVVAPYVAAETSNLARDKRDIGVAARNKISDVMRAHFAVAAEAYVKCAAAVQDEKFAELGVTDSALLCILRDNKGLHLLTDDHALSQIGHSRKLNVHNFNHIRDQREDFRA